MRGFDSGIAARPSATNFPDGLQAIALQPEVERSSPDDQVLHSAWPEASNP
jgi:hypothetical protein